MTNVLSRSIAGGLACIALIIGASVASADSIIITKDQAPEGEQYIVTQHVEPVTPPDGLDMEVGAVVPETVEVRRLAMPSLPKEYEYMVVNQQTVIGDPETRKIAQILH